MADNLSRPQRARIAAANALDAALSQRPAPTTKRAAKPSRVVFFDRADSRGRAVTPDEYARIVRNGI